MPRHVEVAGDALEPRSLPILPRRDATVVRMPAVPLGSAASAEPALGCSPPTPHPNRAGVMTCAVADAA